MARILLEPGCPVTMEKNLALDDEVKLYYDIVENNGYCPDDDTPNCFFNYEPPSVMYKSYQECPDAAVAKLAACLENYWLNKNDWENLKTTMKLYGQDGANAKREQEITSKRRMSYEIIIATLWAQFDVEAGQVADAKAITKRGVAVEISKLVDGTAWPGGEQRKIDDDTVRNIIKEIQEDILQ